MLFSFQQPIKAPTAVSTVVTGESIYYDVSLKNKLKYKLLMVFNLLVLNYNLC